MRNLTDSFETLCVCVPTLCKYMLNMYLDFHTLYSLPLPLGFVLLSFFAPAFGALDRHRQRLKLGKLHL